MYSFLIGAARVADNLAPAIFGGCALVPVDGGWIGRCPFHAGTRQPTLFVSGRYPLWRCFAGHEGGDWTAYLARRHGLNLPESILAIAQRTKSAGPVFLPNESDWRRADRRGTLLWAVEHLSQGRLWTKRGREAVTSLTARGVREEKIVADGVGIVTTPDETRAYLREKGLFDPALFADCGLDAAVDYAVRVADRDPIGRVTGFREYGPPA
jgi:DNA primase